MGVAIVETLYLFNYRGPRDNLDKLAFVSGHLQGGVRALQIILTDAVDNHSQASLKIPKNVGIKMLSKSIDNKIQNLIK